MSDDESKEKLLGRHDLASNSSTHHRSLDTEGNDEIKRLGQEKLAAEIESLRAEVQQREVERRKLELEIKKIDQDVRAHWFGRTGSEITAVTALVLAFVSVATMTCNWRLEVSRREAEEFTQVVRDFSSESSSVRAGAAVQLGAVAQLSDEGRARPARTLLLAALGVEREFNVRHAIETILVALGPDLLPDVQSRSTELGREVKIAFGRGQKPTCEAFGESLVQLRTMQEGVLTLARVKARLTGQALDLKGAPFRCAMLLGLEAKGVEMQEAILWQADLSRARLADANLRDAQMDEADLGESEIAGARFCGDKLTGLTTEMIRAANGWEGAYFTRRFAEELAKSAGKSPLVCPEETISGAGKSKP